MAEALVRILDKGAHASHLRAGDLVAVREDGHAWGSHELEAPWLILVKVPGFSAAEMGAMLLPDDDRDRDHPTARPRKERCSFPLLPAAQRATVNALIAAATVADGQFATPRAVESIEVTAAQWRAARLPKAARPL